MLEFLGTWETIYNPNFNSVEFDGFRKNVGLHTFTLSVSQWCEKTNAIGIYSKRGKYGGTYAHKDIDLNEINPDDILDIKSIKIDKRKTKEERMLDFLIQIENPYVFKINRHLVQIRFSDTNKTAEDCLTNVLQKLYR